MREAFPVESFQDLFDAEARNFWFRSRNRLIIWSLQKYFPNVLRFLEIGCGTGFVLTGIEKMFPNVTLSGSEIHVKGLAYAAKRLKKAFLFQMDARHVSFENEFDVIGCFDVLEHVEQDGAILSQMFQALRSGGGIILTVPQHRFLWSPSDVFACHLRRYSAVELKEKVERAGFSIRRMTSFVSLLLPAMITSRTWQKLVYTKFNVTDELRVGEVVNIMLERILDVERWLISRGVNFPYGGSLLVVAAKL